LIKKEHKTIRN